MMYYMAHYKEWDMKGNLIKAEIYENGNRVQIIR